MSYSIYILLGTIPSIIWLLFYLRKDSHPESNGMVLKIFFYGMLATLPAILIEMGILEEIKNLHGIFQQIVYLFLGVALVEEVLKYLVVRGKVFCSAEMDEPTDVMLYMIIAALGFAALENILLLLPLGPTFLLKEASLIILFRFLGATLLHALCSGLVGFFMAMSFYKTKMRTLFSIIGLSMAIILHGLYNFSIIEGKDIERFFIPLLIIISLSIFVTYGFKKLKKTASVCKI